MSNKIAFILDHKLHDYRVPLFSSLSKYYEITVFHRGPEVNLQNNFQQKVLAYNKVGPFETIRGLPNLSDYSAVIIMQNLRLLNLYTLPISMFNKPCLMWGIGTSSSEGLGSESKLSISLRNLVSLMYRGLALYSSIPVCNYWQKNKDKVNVVGNSILNNDSSDMSDEDKKYFLFIGSLNKRKGLVELLESFKQSVLLYPDLQLKIIGDGPEKATVEQRIKALSLDRNVQLLGKISDSAVKKEFFSKAYCVISPLQAGLSVVESFSYGVPFVTSTTAITGGESQSINHDVNGVLLENVSELSDVICSFIDGRRSSSLLGSNAYQFYVENLAFNLYVKRFKNFIKQHLEN